jgi:shikimate dehydrogenase
MTKKKFAVLGDPIEHSLSPAIHQAAYQTLGLDWTYQKVHVHAGDLASFVSNEGSEFDGFSVTMPLKEEAASLAEQAHPLVQQLGIANTLLREENGWKAYNTDIFGIVKSLGAFWSSKPKSIAILGAGATAQSALMALHYEVPSADVVVYARESSNVDPITSLAQRLAVDMRVTTLEEFKHTQDLTINTIPSTSISRATGTQAGWLLDVNYANPDLDFTSLFDSEKVVTGRMMLLWQAIAQIRLFMTTDMDQELPGEVGILSTMKAALQ